MTSKENFVIAVPSKGRLQENAAAFFARAGLQVVQGRGVRDYRGTIAGMAGVEIAFLSASEIVSHLASGSVHMGVTGEDLIRENVLDASARVEILTPLGFGHANVVVAVPQAWIDVKTMADLEDVASAFRAKRGARMRVATKYINLTRTYFDRMGVADYRIVESLGATEGAPAAGQAEIIVDITTTGATLAANALKVLDDGIILRSEANLVASVNASWTESMRETARRILSRIAAEEDARTSRQVRAVVAGPKTRLIEEAAKTFAARAPFGAQADGPLTFICPKAGVPALADWLVMQGAEHVTVETLDYIFGARNPLFDKLTARLP
ncbi:MAG: ATP phosphoribosyltransferase [Alphaproteobacteria bacterium]|nr:ATP phosphoribosyltransferase [Alphaproteobacteria bacterium]